MMRERGGSAVRWLIVVPIVAAASFGCSSSGNKGDGGAGHDGGGADHAGSGGGAGADGSAGMGGTGGMAGGGAGVDGGAGSDGGAPDADASANVDLKSTAEVPETNVPPNAPTNLAAAPLDRRKTTFKLSWTAPATSWGAPVSGYAIRAATVPITAANFNDATVTTVVLYAGTPSDVGQPDGVVTQALYIETGYFFAVEAVDANGNFSMVAATNAAVAAHFNQAILPSPTGTNQEFGAPVDGSGDGNHDGLSDLLVGCANDTHAYLFLGASTIPTAPSVTFTGMGANFGANVAWIGDVDGDGFDDAAISDPANVRVLIYKGRAVWPTMLDDTQFSYSVTTDASYAATGFGSIMAALGDFDGDGVADFAIGANGFSGNAGHLDVIYGAKPFTNVALPSTTRALGIGPDVALTRSLLGTAIVGIGHFYAGAGTTLVASAPGVGNATSTSSNEGRLYAFHGRGPGAAITAAAADNTLVGPAKSAKIGTVLSNLGPMINTLAAVGSGNTADTFSATTPGGTGTAFVLSGSAALGPFNADLVVVQSSSIPVGQVIFGGGFSGRDGAVSLIGGAQPDLVMTGQSATGIDIVDGAVVPTLTSPSNVRMTGQVHIPLPAGWTQAARAPGNLMKDINGDGVADFAIADLFGVVPGRVIVFW
jgi:hypothetical protein